MFLLSYAIKSANPRLTADTVALSLHANESDALKKLAGLVLPHLLNFSDILIEDRGINPYGPVQGADALLGLLFQETAEQVASRQASKGYSEDLIIARMNTAASDDSAWTADSRRALCDWLFAFMNNDERDAFYTITPLSALLPDAEKTSAAPIESLWFEATDVSVQQDVLILDPSYDVTAIQDGLNEGRLATTLGSDRLSRQYIEVVATGAPVAEIIAQSTDGDYHDFQHRPQ